MIEVRVSVVSLAPALAGQDNGARVAFWTERQDLMLRFADAVRRRLLSWRFTDHGVRVSIDFADCVPSVRLGDFYEAGDAREVAERIALGFVNDEIERYRIM